MTNESTSFHADFGYDGILAGFELNAILVWRRRNCSDYCGVFPNLHTELRNIPKFIGEKPPQGIYIVTIIWQLNWIDLGGKAFSAGARSDRPAELM